MAPHALFIGLITLNFFLDAQAAQASPRSSAQIARLVRRDMIDHNVVRALQRRTNGDSPRGPRYPADAAREQEGPAGGASPRSSLAQEGYATPRLRTESPQGVLEHYSELPPTQRYFVPQHRTAGGHVVHSQVMDEIINFSRKAHEVKQKAESMEGMEGKKDESLRWLARDKRLERQLHGLYRQHGDNNAQLALKHHIVDHLTRKGRREVCVL